MNFEYKNLMPSHRDFRNLAEELNLSLLKITSDSGQSSFSEESFDPESDGCILVYSELKPVACGIFRHHTTKTCELKRMYSKLSGAGSYLLTQIEELAVEKGYHEAILSTRRINEKAVQFYKRNRYVESEAYGKYIGMKSSVCMSKTLVK